MNLRWTKGKKQISTNKLKSYIWEKCLEECDPLVTSADGDLDLWIGAKECALKKAYKLNLTSTVEDTLIEVMRLTSYANHLLHALFLKVTTSLDKSN